MQRWTSWARPDTRTVRPPLKAIALAGLGAGLAILALALLQSYTTLIALVPAFGASCALIFAHSDSPFAQPRNVIGGHLITAAIGIATLAAIGSGPWALAIGVGLAVSAMMLTRTMHPPAGGNPLLVILTGAKLSFLVEPILLGSVAVVLVGLAYHSVFSGEAYPRRPIH